MRAVSKLESEHCRFCRATLIADCSVTSRAYITVLDDSPRSFVSSIASFVISLSELVFGGTSTLPPAVSNPGSDQRTTPAVRVESLQEKMKRVTVSDSTASTSGTQETPLSPLPDVTPSPFTPILDRLAKLDPSTPSAQELEAEAKRKAKRKADDAKKNNRFRDLPPEMIVVLLPFFELFNANKSFSHLIFASDEQSDIAVKSIRQSRSPSFSTALLMQIVAQRRLSSRCHPTS